MILAAEASLKLFFQKYGIRFERLKQNISLWLILPLLVCGDMVGVFSAHLLAYWFRMFHFFPPPSLPPLSAYTQLALFSALLTPLLFLVCRLYNPRLEVSYFDEVVHIILGCTWVSAMGFVGIFFLRHLLPYETFTFSRWVAVFAWIAAIGLVIFLRTGIRLLQNWLRKFGWGVHRVLIFGQGSAADELLKREEKFLRQGYQIMRCIPPDRQQLADWCQTYQADTLLILQHNLSGQDLSDLVVDCQRLHLKMNLLPDFTQLRAARLSFTEAGGLPLLTVDEVPLRYPSNRLRKRLFDMGLAIIGLVLLSPLFIFISVLIRVTSGSPVFYRQERISRDGERFYIYKFRTMPDDSECETGPIWTQAGDNRCTPIGIFLRRSSLDELPQLFNVLKGEMSLVGPRPERPFFVEQFEQEVLNYPERHLVKAGLTGWAQVNGLRGDTSVHDRTRFDLYYIENWSLLFDIRIILKSFYIVIRDYINKQAY